MNVVDRAWLAGLLEGEGCFTLHVQKYRRKSDGGLSVYRRPAITIGMTDRDPVARAAALFGGYAIIAKDRSRENNRKTSYSTMVTGTVAVALMRELRPLMGERRRARIDQLLEGYL